MKTATVCVSVMTNVAVDILEMEMEMEEHTIISVSNLFAGCTT